MLIALTGTPGVGKTTIAQLLPYRVMDLNSLVREGHNLGEDGERGCLEADMVSLSRYLEESSEASGQEPCILEGHFSHLLASEAVVLRLHPRELLRRLRQRGYGRAKIRENLEAESMDLILSEAVDRCRKVWEIDTTGLDSPQVAALVVKAISGLADMPPRGMNWLEEGLEIIEEELGP